MKKTWCDTENRDLFNIQSSLFIMDLILKWTSLYDWFEGHSKSRFQIMYCMPLWRRVIMDSRYNGLSNRSTEVHYKETWLYTVGTVCWLTCVRVLMSEQIWSSRIVTRRCCLCSQLSSLTVILLIRLSLTLVINQSKSSHIYGNQSNSFSTPSSTNQYLATNENLVSSW